jgi:hypothetical protein
MWYGGRGECVASGSQSVWTDSDPQPPSKSPAAATTLILIFPIPSSRRHDDGAAMFAGGERARHWDIRQRALRKARGSRKGNPGAGGNGLPDKTLQVQRVFARPSLRVSPMSGRSGLRQRMAMDNRNLYSIFAAILPPMLGFGLIELYMVRDVSIATVAVALVALGLLMVLISTLVEVAAAAPDGRRRRRRSRE